MLQVPNQISSSFFRRLSRIDVRMPDEDPAGVNGVVSGTISFWNDRSWPSARGKSLKPTRLRLCTFMVRGFVGNPRMFRDQAHNSLPCIAGRTSLGTQFPHPFPYDAGGF